MRRDIVDVLDTVDEQCGPSRLLDQHRGRQYRALGDEAAAARYTQRFDAAASLAPWEHVARARLLILESRTPAAHAASLAGHGSAASFAERATFAYLSGESFRLAQAAWHCDQALAVEPDMFWAHFYRGVSAYRQSAFSDAAASFQVCIALQPRHAPSFHNRALAAARLDNAEQALADYAKALELDPSLGMAALHRAQLHLHLRNFAAAQADLLLAQERGADPEMVRTHLARLEKMRAAPQQ
jgi:Tfp pilus assembly protein PilF